MKGLHILLDVEKFPLPQQNNVLLETFLSIKEEIVKSLLSIEEKTMGTANFIVVVLHPDKITFNYLIHDPILEEEIVSLISERMDLSKIAGRILTKDLN